MRAKSLLLGAGLFCLVACVVLLTITSSTNGTTALFSPSAFFAPMPPLFRRSAIVIRHCARATVTHLHHMEPYTELDDYVKRPFPVWNVQGKNCLTRGVELMRAEGRHLTSVVHGMLRVVADGSVRDEQSAMGVMEGLGMSDPNAYAVDVKHELFFPQKAGICPLASKERLQEVKEMASRACPITAHDMELRAELQARLGRGKAPALQTIPDELIDGELVGGTAVAHAMSFQLLMLLGGGYDNHVGISPADVRRLDGVSRRFYCINSRNEEIVRGMSNLVVDLLRYLEGESMDGTSLYLGHETQINGLAAVLGLRWFPHAYYPDSTPPGCMLRFEVTGDVEGNRNVEVFYDYSTLGPKTGENLYSTPAFFSSTGQSKMDYLDFRSLALSRVDPDCVTDV